MVTTLKEIFDNEWEDFRKTSNSPDLKRKAVHDNVWKMRYCKTPWMGVAVYQCPVHFEEVKLFACTCKSRFCPPCGFKANQVWFHNLMQRVLRCEHQHLVFSLPYELRELARFNRRKIFRLMARTANAAIMRFIRKRKNLNYLPGMVAILHTFGSGLKWHIHFHVLITAGGMRGDKFIFNGYLNEKALKETWKAKFLKGLRKLYRKELLANAVGRHPGQTFLSMLSDIYEDNWHTWIGDTDKDSIFTISYIGRYAKRACISQKGITKYRIHEEVEWEERSKKKKTPAHCRHRKPPSEFIDLLIQHIPDHYEHQIYYYGLYSPYHLGRGQYQKAKQILEKKLPEQMQNAFSSKDGAKVLTYRQLMRWTHDLDPMECSICKKTLELTGIIFFNPGLPKDRDILDNYEIKKYQLVKKADTS